MLNFLGFCAVAIIRMCRKTPTNASINILNKGLQMQSA